MPSTVDELEPLPQRALLPAIRDLTDALMLSTSERQWRLRARSLSMILKANPGWRSQYVQHNLGARREFLEAFAKEQEVA